MIILGIDPGSLITGYGFLETEGNRFRVLDAGPFRLKKQGAIQDRLIYLFRELDRKIEEYKPSVLSIEKVFGGVNFNATLLLGYVRGVVLTLAAKNDMEVYEYAPTEVKKSLTGYGRAEKSQIQEMVRILLGLRTAPKPHDVADALALAICHAHHRPFVQKVTR